MATKHTASKARKSSANSHTPALPVATKATTRNALALGPDGTLPPFAALPLAQKRLEVLKALSIVDGLLWANDEQRWRKEYRWEKPRLEKMRRIQRKLNGTPFTSKRYGELERDLRQLERQHKALRKDYLIHHEMHEFVKNELSRFRYMGGSWDAPKPFLDSWHGPFAWPWTKGGTYTELKEKLRNPKP
jgi:hypothetical protein